MSIILTAENLSKIYPNGTKAVDDISFSLDRGEIFGFLGPNGAGKTTTVKLLCGMLTPTSGKSQVLGIDPSLSPKHCIKKQVLSPSTHRCMITCPAWIISCFTAHCSA